MSAWGLGLLLSRKDGPPASGPAELAGRARPDLRRPRERAAPVLRATVADAPRQVRPRESQVRTRRCRHDCRSGPGADAPSAAPGPAQQAPAIASRSGDAASVNGGVAPELGHEADQLPARPRPHGSAAAAGAAPASRSVATNIVRATPFQRPSRDGLPSAAAPDGHRAGQGRDPAIRLHQIRAHDVRPTGRTPATPRATAVEALVPGSVGSAPSTSTVVSGWELRLPDRPGAPRRPPPQPAQQPSDHSRRAHPAPRASQRGDSRACPDGRPAASGSF